MKRKLLGLMMAAVMVFGNAGAVLADDAGTQGETYYFQKVYQICMRFPEPAIMTPPHQIESQNWEVFR